MTIRHINIFLAVCEAGENTTKAAELFSKLPEQDHFLESMADACKAVIDYKGAQNMLYINVANRLSVDCDCDSHPAEPEMAGYAYRSPIKS